MKEIDCQSLVIDAVRAHGGAAHKLSNRFLIGVSDLLVKLPDRPAALLEVKLNKFSSLAGLFGLDVTHLQKKFLNDYYDANMGCGVLSFIEHNRKGIRGLYLAAFGLDSMHQTDYHVRREDHVWLGKDKDARHCVINTRIRNWK